MWKKYRNQKELNLHSGYFLCEFGRAMYFVVISWLLFELTNDPLQTGVLVSLGFIPGLLLNLVFGVIVDRFNRKKLAVSAIAIMATTMTLLYISIVYQFVTPAIIFAVHMIVQLMGSLFRPSIQAFIAEVFEKVELPRIYSKVSAASTVGGLVGASLGGVMIGLFSEGVSILVVSCSLYLAVLMLAFVKATMPIKTTITKNSAFSDLVDGFHYLKNNQVLYSLFGTMFIGQLVFHSSIGFLSVYTVEHLGQEAAVYGFLDATISLGGILAGVLGAWWWSKNKNYLSIRSFFIVFAGLLVFILTDYLPFIFIGAFLVGIGTTWIRILLQSVQLIATDGNYHGRMASYRILCNQGSVVISGPILGLIAANYGSQYVYGALLCPVAIGVFLSIKQSKQPVFKEITSKAA
ncbi:MFS transporter [Radiobacillus sp. PE A8.2]|uniref:MFS transporter n=1 Tax=Radiobacillus sp. PE A8.2 TaxID=3380349 RepID=UPI00388D7FE5